MPTFRLSKNFSATLSTEDYELLRTHAQTNNTSVSHAIRSALSHYLHAPTPPAPLHPTRAHTVNFAIPSATLRKELYAYAEAHKCSITQLVQAAVRHQKKSNSLT
jgi:hypothetical protein